jgi:hypothetical protein
LPRIKENEVKPNKEKNKKNDHNAAHKDTTTHRIQADSQNQHVNVVLASSYDAVMRTLQDTKRHMLPSAAVKQPKTSMPTAVSTSALRASSSVSITL